MTFSMVLKQLREELQLQQKELAELLGVNSTTVNRWEVGKTHPTKAICNLLLCVAKENGHLAKSVNPEELYWELTRYMSESRCDNEQDEGGGNKQ